MLWAAAAKGRYHRESDGEDAYLCQLEKNRWTPETDWARQIDPGSHGVAWAGEEAAE